MSESSKSVLSIFSIFFNSPSNIFGKEGFIYKGNPPENLFIQAS